PNYNNGGPSFDLSSGSMLLSQDDQDALFSTDLDPDNYNYYDDDY
ncbi:8878_t:CDS:2, partial [Gigaspora rosea]